MHVAQNPIDDEGLRPTARDPYLQLVVEAAIEKQLYPDARLLDIGCGDGLSTIRFANFTGGQTLGIDYIDEYVEMSRENAVKSQAQMVTFEQGDILNLSPIIAQYGKFDIVITIRCLINLPTWNLQISAIEQLAQCTQPGGIYLASEGWLEGLQNLNLLRFRAGLSDISVAKHNLLMSRLQFEHEVSKHFDLLTYINLGFYHYLSKVVQPVYTRPQTPSHTHMINKVAAELINTEAIDTGAFDSCDYSGIYVLRRKI